MMAKYMIGVRAIFVLFALVHTVCAAADQHCNRVVSLAPSITESLHALGMLPSIVGRTTYDGYPPEIQHVRSIGGFLDPNIETIVALKPTAVVGLAEQGELIATVQRLKLKTLTVDQRSVEGILNSFSLIGELCGISEKAHSVVAQMQRVLNQAQRASNVKKRVMIVVSRDYASAHLREVYLSGSDGYYDSLLRYAGGENIFHSVTGSLTGASIEGIYAMNPDIIIEMLPPGEIQKYGLQALKAPWNALPGVKAVALGNIFLLDDDWATIPGPRMIILLERLREIIGGATTR